MRNGVSRESLGSILLPSVIRTCLIAGEPPHE
jgi:hypothetical protein